MVFVSVVAESAFKSRAFGFFQKLFSVVLIALFIISSLTSLKISCVKSEI